MTMQTIMIVGAGQMGGGIAQVAAEAGMTALLYDVLPSFAEQAVSEISKRLDRAIAKGKLTEEAKAEIIGRIEPVGHPEEASRADIVVEAATESLEVKLSLFRKLDAVCPSSVVLATNTSSLPITEIAAVTANPARVVGMHFMNPVPVMPLVEVIRGLETSEETFEATWRLAERLGKTPVAVNDFPGFVSNRVLMPMINEAIFAVYEGVAAPEAVDQVMKLGMNHPMGPLELADFIGLDTCLSIMNVLYDGFKDSKYRPCPLLRQYVKAGRLGRKSGRGFYVYE